LNLKIAYISPSDPNDKDAQSGQIHYIFEMLKIFGEVIFLTPFTIKFYYHLRIINKIAQLFFHKGYNFAFNLTNSKKTGKELTHRLIKDQFDLIFTPYGSMQIAFLKTSLPIIYLADTTFQNMIDYYPTFSNLLSFSQWEGNLIEKRAINKASQVLYPSEWAANSAIRDYGAPPEKVHVIPTTPSMDRIPPAGVEKAKTGESCNLLFVGRDWQRKGGDLAVAAREKLADSGLQAQLTIVGCQPSLKSASDIRVIPYLNKNRAEEARILEELYEEADFLILPTRADCSSVVTAEANAYGVPVIATQTGGLPSLIKEGINGYLLPLSAKGEDFAKVISTVFRDEKTYKKLRQTSRQEYEKCMSSEAWSQKVAEIIDRVLA
jgi:glycosyltransferase involved in cell wall biosynthesis